MSQEKYPEYTPWVEHIYSALRWSEGSIRKLHELLEAETVTDEIKGRAAQAISWIESARREAFFAFEKMGSGSTREQAKFDISSIGEETKVKILRLNAAFIEETVAAINPGSIEELRKTLGEVIQTMREEASAIEAKLKKHLEGPPETGL